MSTVSSIYSFFVEIWSKNKEKITDFFLFFTILLISTGLHLLTLILKIRFFIFRLKDQIAQLDTLIVLLDNHAILLQQKQKVAVWAKINNNIETAALILLGVVIAIAIVLFFFSDKGGPGGSTTPSASDSFTPRGSEGSLSRSPSSLDLGVKETLGVNSNVDTSVNITNNVLSSITEGNTINTPILDMAKPLNDSLSGTFAQIHSILYPNVIIWDTISKKHLFEQSPTVRVGSVLKDWVANLTKTYTSLDNSYNEDVKSSTETLKDIELTLNSIDLNLPPFIEQVNGFLKQTNLNQLYSNLNADYSYVLEARDAAFELTQILLEHESILNQMLPGNIIVPEWFGALIGFYSFLNVVSNLYSNNLPEYLVSIGASIDVSIISDEDLTLKNTLFKRLELIYRYVSKFVANYDNRLGGGGAFLSVMEEGYDLEEQTSSRVFSNLLKIVLKYRDCFSVDPSNIFLFV